jgi:hypothetical protein
LGERADLHALNLHWRTDFQPLATSLEEADKPVLFGEQAPGTKDDQRADDHARLPITKAPMAVGLNRLTMAG